MWPFKKAEPAVRTNPVYLKVKLKSLAEEAKIIKKEENKRKVPRIRIRIATPDGNLQRRKPVLQEAIDAIKETHAEDRARRAKRRGRDWYAKSAEELHGLHLHRILHVRKEARLTQIAYGYLRGREFKQVDSGNDLTGADWERITQMVRKYGDGVDTNVAKWAGVK
jgi:hypothetical protein